MVWASNKGRDSVVRALVDARADVRLHDCAGWTALMWAVDGGHASIVQQLLEAGADALDTDEDGNHALELAELQGNNDVAALLQAAIDATREQEGTRASGGEREAKGSLLTRTTSSACMIA